MGFSADWLALREPVDLAARDPGLLARAAALAGPGVVVADLGSGTGSTARAFGQQPSDGATWRFLDNDAALLDLAGSRHQGAQRVEIDLGDVNALPVHDAALVTASALLDLMPRAWIYALAERLSKLGVPFYAALNYNGVMHWTPAHDLDATITEAFNAHQQTDKGLGPAMGGASGTETRAAFEAAGFDVHCADSPWTLGPLQIDLHRELIDGIATAAGEMGIARSADWATARETSVAQSRAIIGHTDLLALPRA